MGIEHQPVVTLKIFDGSLENGDVYWSPPIDLRDMTIKGLFSSHVIRGGSGELAITCFMGPEEGLIIPVQTSSLYLRSWPAFYEQPTIYRKCIDNVATIRTAYEAFPGLFVLVTGMSDSSYNGIHKITEIIDDWTFSYSLVHPFEAQTTDFAGTVLGLEYQSRVFSVTKPVPWIQFKIQATAGFGSGFPCAKLWVNIH